jgi:hypothetical protein
MVTFSLSFALDSQRGAPEITPSSNSAVPDRLAEPQCSSGRTYFHLEAPLGAIGNRAARDGNTVLRRIQRVFRLK